MVDGTPTPAQEPDVEMYGIRENDPTGTLIDRGNLTDEELSQIGRLMGALSELRDAERKLSQASARHLALNETDMRALHYLMVCENQGVTVTPSMITKHLKISPATTTKLLDRLEAGDHIDRTRHDSDRRVQHITVNPTTRKAAYEAVGLVQSRRFYAAAQLSPGERETVISFLNDMAQRIDITNVDWPDT